MEVDLALDMQRSPLIDREVSDLDREKFRKRVQEGIQRSKLKQEKANISVQDEPDQEFDKG